MSTTITGVVTNGVVVTSLRLPEGAKVEVTVVRDQAKPRQLSMLELLETLPPGPRAFDSWEKYEQHLREEKEAWDR